MSEKPKVFKKDPQEDSTNKFGEYRIYKPKKGGDGAASRFQLRNAEEKYRKVYLFWSIAHQDGFDGENAKFDWAGAINVKLDLVDIGEILTVLSGQKVSVGNGKGLFHQNSKGNTVIQFQYYQPDNGEPMYTTRISSQRDGVKTECKHTFTLGEGEVLRVLLSRAVLSHLGW